MFEEDFIIREIKMAIKMAMQLVFGREVESPATEALAFLTHANETGEEPDIIFQLMREKRYREAEKNLFSRADAEKPQMMKAGLIFYDTMSKLGPAELETYGYDSDKLADGLHRLLTIYGYNDVGNLFLQ